MRYQPTETLLSLDELTALCAEWQETLQLQDWMIAIAILRDRDMANPGNHAQCYYVQRTKEAKISIIDPIDFPTKSVFKQDMEQTLVHELLHLHFAPIWDEDREVAGEQAVNAIANGLIATKRSNHQKL